MSDDRWPMDSADLDFFSEQNVRRFWKSVVEHGHHVGVRSLEIKLGCADETTAALVAAHFQANDHRDVRVREVTDSREPTPEWEVIGSTPPRVIDEEYFVEVHEWMASTIQRFGCHFRALSNSGRAA